MNITLISFSPTGGTLKCAGILAKAMGDVKQKIDLTDRNLAAVTADEELAVIAVPSYSGRMPRLAVERLKKVNGNGRQAVVMVVYGNRAYEDTLVELSDTAVAAGFKPVAAVTAVAQHCMVNEVAQGRPDTEDEKALTVFGEKIKAAFEAGALKEPELPGNRPYHKEGVGLVPKTNGKCTSCGKCAQMCPSGAIDKTNPKIVDKKICVNCVRCVSICPEQAKYLPKMMIGLVSMVLKKKCKERREAELFL